LEVDITHGTGYPPDGSTLGGLAGSLGGIHLLLEISGVPANTDIGSIGFDVQYRGGKGTGQSVGSDPVRAQARIDGEVIDGYDLVGVSDFSSPGSVGPTGTVRVELILLDPGVLHQGNVSLDINAIDITPLSNVPTYVPGPWHFDIPLS